MKSTVLLKYIGLLIAGVFLGAIVLEAILQAGAMAHSLGKSTRNTIAKNKSGVKILCLGESTTEGQYPCILEEVLNSRKIGVSFSVIDKGRVAVPTDYIVGNLSNYLAEFNPDIVVTMMGVNDRWDDLAVLQYTHGPWYSALRTYKLVKLIGLHAKEKMKSWHSIRSQLSDNTVFSGGKTVDEQSNKSESEKMFQQALEINPHNKDVMICPIAKT